MNERQRKRKEIQDKIDKIECAKTRKQWQECSDEEFKAMIKQVGILVRERMKYETTAYIKSSYEASRVAEFFAANPHHPY